jgi:beta-phosphoglucomutase family hydrolase
MLGLPGGVLAGLFDLDGVLTRTASVHAAAWKQTFDSYLRARAARMGEPFVPFDEVRDYDAYVDGRPRADGTRTFLASRHIELPEGDPDDPPGKETIQGLSNLKNENVLERFRTGGVETFPGSVRYLEATRDAGLMRAVVTSSANAAEVLAVAKIDHLFQARVDGKTIEHDHLPGKPAPDTYLAAAAALGVEPAAAAVFEDALAGVAAGRAGHFGFVVGVDRTGQAADLLSHGADIVVQDLAELLDNR